MALKKKDARNKRPNPISFRMSEQAKKSLEVLAKVMNMTQVEVIEALLAEGYQKAKKSYPEDMKKAEKSSRLPSEK